MSGNAGINGFNCGSREQLTDVDPSRMVLVIQCLDRNVLVFNLVPEAGRDSIFEGSFTNPCVFPEREVSLPLKVFGVLQNNIPGMNPVSFAITLASAESCL